METTSHTIAPAHDPRNGVADLTCEILAYDNVVKDERIASLEAEVIKYREMTCVLMGALHDSGNELQRVGDDRDRIRDEFRALRVQVMRDAEKTFRASTTLDRRQVKDVLDLPTRVTQPEGAPCH